MEFTFKTSYLVFRKWQKYNILGTLCTNSEPSPYPKDNQLNIGLELKNIIILGRKEWYIQKK